MKYTALKILMFFTYIVVPVFMLRSCYMNINLCSREEVKQAVIANLYSEIHHDLQQYIKQREQIFETAFEKKFGQKCLLQSENASNENDRICLESKEQKSIELERSSFNQVLNQYLSNHSDLTESAQYYHNYVQMQKDFKVDLLYEKIIAVLEPQVKHLKNEFIQSKQKVLKDQIGQIESDMNIQLLYLDYLTAALALRFTQVEPIDGFWSTFWGSRKHCSAQVSLGENAGQMITVDYYSHTKTSYANRNGHARYTADLNYISMGQYQLINQEQRIDFFSHFLKASAFNKS